MFKELKELRDFILKFLPDIKLIFSTPVIRTDKRKREQQTIYQLSQKGKV